MFLVAFCYFFSQIHDFCQKYFRPTTICPYVSIRCTKEDKIFDSTGELSRKSYPRTFRLHGFFHRNNVELLQLNWQFSNPSTSSTASYLCTHHKLSLMVFAAFEVSLEITKIFPTAKNLSKTRVLKSDSRALTPSCHPIKLSSYYRVFDNFM